MTGLDVKVTVANCLGLAGQAAIGAVIAGACLLGDVEKAVKPRLCRVLGHRWVQRHAHARNFLSCSRCSEPGFRMPS